MPRVTTIIPCFNAGRFLPQTLESVFGQTFKDYEVIVVDDGSWDQTASIIKSFSSNVVADLGSHRGASAARNRGTQLARGEFIQYLDADDLLRPDALEKKVNALVSSEADVAYSDWQKLEETGNGTFHPREVVSRKIEDVHKDFEIALFTNFWAPPAALLYRRRIVDAIGSWNESLPIIQDARFLLDAALHGARFVHVPGVGADYRVHKNQSLSRRDPIAFAKDVFLNACQIQEIWQCRGGLSQSQRSVLLDVFSYVARVFFENKCDEFERAMEKISRLDSSFRFKYPHVANLLHRAIGRPRAIQLMKYMVALHQRL